MKGFLSYLSDHSIKRLTLLNCKTAILFFTTSLLSSCMVHRQGMYLSPTNSLVNTYHTIPHQSDSLKSAIYASLVFSTGTANDSGYDRIMAGQASFYRSHNLGKCQAYYGANLTLGGYSLADFYNSHYYYYSGSPIDTFYHIPANKYFFGSYGLSAGFNGVATHHRGEWRYLGVEAAIQKEFGNYYPFRKSLPDSAANIIFRNNLTGIIGLYTDALWSYRDGNQFGIKFSVYRLLNAETEYTSQNAYNIFPVIFFSLTLHGTGKRFTGFIQFNAGTKASSFQIGTSYRISR
jgi:hypothetical protein